jgi:predicted RND superfamily exporter protein
MDEAEFKLLRQEVDGLSEQISILVENHEVRHAELMAKLDFLEERIVESGESEAEEISEKVSEQISAEIEGIKTEVENMSEMVQNIEEGLDAK